MKTKISLVIFGYIHRDPAAIHFLMDCIKKYHQQGVKMVFCEEDNSDQTLDNRIRGNEIGVENIQIPLNQEPIKKFCKKDKNLSFSYIPLSKLEELVSIIHSIFPSLTMHQIRELSWCILRKN